MQGHYPKILINHVGFCPEAGKYAAIDGITGVEERFRVVKMNQLGDNPVLTGPLVQFGSDLGNYLVGDLSNLREPGVYRIYVSGQYPFVRKGGALDVRSYDFRIEDRVWDEPLKKLVNYYQMQSCGSSKRGYNRPCHTGKIRRDDGGEAKPVPGGWHSAHDGSRTVHEIIHGLYGLQALASLRPDLREELDLLHEIRWGNEYFLTIQDPAGFLHHGVTLSAEAFHDAVKHNWWDTASYFMRTRPAPLYLQYHFSGAQALFSMLFREKDPAYADRCLQAGIRCFEYAGSQKHCPWFGEQTSYELGTAISAGVHLFRATGQERYRDFAGEMARRLLDLQTETGFWQEQTGGAFIADATDVDHEKLVARTIYAPLVVLGLIDATRWLKDEPGRPRWLKSLSRFAENCIGRFSRANAFGIMPYRIFNEAPRQTCRDWNGARYRYFMETNYAIFHSPKEFCWQTGNNPNVAGYGVALIQLAKLLNAPELMKLAQRQLDWVLGVNPFDASMIIGVGRNQPAVYAGTQMVPRPPEITGAVLQGPIGDAEDNPVIIPGYYPVAEYWMPTQAWALWLMAGLSRKSDTDG